MKDPQKLYLNRYIVSHPCDEHLFPSDVSIRLTNEETHLQKLLVDKEGAILDFPGIDYCPVLTAEIGSKPIQPVVRYEIQLEKQSDDTFLMVWTVRPDGRYWMDSWGFGAEDYEDVALYTLVDAAGNYTAPFRLYNIGKTLYGPRRLSSDLSD